jgi:hypothetical protein
MKVVPLLGFERLLDTPSVLRPVFAWSEEIPVRCALG